MENEDSSIKVICVLKSGGDYDERYVYALRNAVDKHLSCVSDFYCFSDMEVKPLCNRLIKGYPGWWSKLEAFKLKGPALYIDLDTVVLGSIDKWAEAVEQLGEDQFMMLKPFNKAQKWASGLMGWNGDFSWLFNEFDYKKRPHKFDQVYISNKLLGKKIEIIPIQDYLPGLYSYKHHCRGNGGPPKDTSAILFHGKPRPHEVKDIWVKENWR